jgi:hypothetical protein
VGASACGCRVHTPQKCREGMQAKAACLQARLDRPCLPTGLTGSGRTRWGLWSARSSNMDALCFSVVCSTRRQLYVRVATVRHPQPHLSHHHPHRPHRLQTFTSAVCKHRRSHLLTLIQHPGVNEPTATNTRNEQHGCTAACSVSLPCMAREGPGPETSRHLVCAGTECWECIVFVLVHFLFATHSHSHVHKRMSIHVLFSQHRRFGACCTAVAEK